MYSVVRKTVSKFVPRKKALETQYIVSSEYNMAIVPLVNQDNVIKKYLFFLNKKPQVVLDFYKSTQIIEKKLVDYKYNKATFMTRIPR